MEDYGGQQDVEKYLWIKSALLINLTFISISNFSSEVVHPSLVLILHQINLLMSSLEIHLVWWAIHVELMSQFVRLHWANIDLGHWIVIVNSESDDCSYHQTIHHCQTCLVDESNSSEIT